MASNKAVIGIATIPLKSDIVINDKSSKLHQTVGEIHAMLKQQNGFRSGYYGTEVENPSILQLVIDWDNDDYRKSFERSPARVSMSKNFDSISSGPWQLYHFYPTPSQTSIFGSAPIVEMVTFYNVQPYYISNIEKFIAGAFAGDVEGNLGHIFGPVVEQIEKLEGGSKGPAVMACYGWAFQGAHVKFFQSDACKQYMSYVMDGAESFEFHQTIFKPF